jgi:hypothetical protein
MRIKMNNEPVALTQVEIMNALTLGIPLYTHPVKELHLSLQKSKQTGELLAVTYTDDEHRIVEVLWQKPPVKELTDEEISLRDYFAAKAMQGLIAGCYAGNNVGFTVEGNVFAAYQYADAMMGARKND